MVDDGGECIPLTHALALLRYGRVDPHGFGLHEIWGGDVSLLAARSLAVLAAFGLAMTQQAIRMFGRSAS
ncbi:MAG: hypothetical protein QOK05_605 [Chloroflexota bacterium]|jgi:hypothetical protein|nr:hypothetical protein [Chloroflexota bacterium]